MKETKTEFLLKKILYYTLGGRKALDKFNEWVETEYKKENEEKPEVVIHNEPEPKEDIEVAPLSLPEKNKLAEHKLFKKLEKYGFTSITISKCKADKLVADDNEGELFFTYLFEQKFGHIERKLLPNQLMSVKFIFNKETRDRVYGEGKG